MLEEWKAWVAVTVLDALALKIGVNFKVRYRHSPGLLGQWDSIREVVKVTMGDKYGIQLSDLLELLWRQRVVG
jgi:hypothetical protein